MYLIPKCEPTSWVRTVGLSICSVEQVTQLWAPKLWTLEPRQGEATTGPDEVFGNIPPGGIGSTEPEPTQKGFHEPSCRLCYSGAPSWVAEGALGPLVLLLLPSLPRQSPALWGWDPLYMLGLASGKNFSLHTNNPLRWWKTLSNHRAWCGTLVPKRFQKVKGGKVAHCWHYNGSALMP